ncbi:class I tRNA ligase family protein [Desulfonema limicola]|uniref:class I tRNA ligase family protein n=1 Tax=Desulfonema limicola TaxID=45656 RepID=UPI003B8304AE
MLGNLSDFKPSEHSIPYESMSDIDKFALYSLSGLINKGKKAYDTYEFHVIYHAIHNYCTLDLSSFYLDILKDRLYTSPPDSIERRSAQTVMFLILDSMAKLLAPILPFTCEEVWTYMPLYQGKQDSIHMASLPDVNQQWKNEDLAGKWKLLLAVRGEVTRALEESRIKKQIGHPLDAFVTLCARDEVLDVLKSYADDLHTFFIVSKTEIAGDPPENAFISKEIDGLCIGVKPAPGKKCERCWIHDISVGTISDTPAICSRCKTQLEAIQ